MRLPTGRDGFPARGTIGWVPMGCPFASRWVHRAQLQDGAIANQSDRVSIWPYEGSYAAWGLATVAARTGDTTRAAQAWRWLFWYKRHQDSNGFVQNYRVKDGREINTE